MMNCNGYAAMIPILMGNRSCNNSTSAMIFKALLSFVPVTPVLF